MPDVHIDPDDLDGVFIETGRPLPEDLELELVIPFAQIPTAVETLRKVADDLEAEYEEDEDG